MFKISFRKNFRLIGDALDIKDIVGLIRNGFAAIGGSSVITATINWFGSNVPILSLILYGIGLFSVFIVTLPLLKNLLNRRKRIGRDPDNQVDSNLAIAKDTENHFENVEVDGRHDALEALYQEQVDAIENLIKIEILEAGSFADGRPLEDQNPYMLFRFRVTNLSMFNIEAEGVTGHIHYRLDQVTSEYKDTPELRKEPPWDNKAFQRPLQLKQWVNREVARFFLTPNQGNVRYVFDFNELNITAKVKLGDNVVHQLRLPLPGQVSIATIRGVDP